MVQTVGLTLLVSGFRFLRSQSWPQGFVPNSEAKHGCRPIRFASNVRVPPHPEVAGWDWLGQSKYYLKGFTFLPCWNSETVTDGFRRSSSNQNQKQKTLLTDVSSYYFSCNRLDYSLKYQETDIRSKSWLFKSARVPCCQCCCLYFSNMTH